MRSLTDFDPIRQRPHKFSCQVLLCLSILSSFVAASQGAPAALAKPSCKGPVCVEMGVPSIWSLQQAHYLLERNRALNRSLRAKPLGELDPNAANSARAEILKQFLGVSAEFSQKALVENRNALRNKGNQEAAKAANDAQIRALRQKRDQLAIERAQAKYEAELIKARPNPDLHAAAEKTAEANRLDAEVNILNQQIADLGTVTVGTATLTETSATDPGAVSKLPGGAANAESITKLLTPLTGKEATIAASTMLDNSLGMQYEILAKQLTLLRDEAGPNRSVLFLELPQSIYTANSGGNDYVVRTRWKVQGMFVEMRSLGKGADQRRFASDICEILVTTRGAPGPAKKLIHDCVPTAAHRLAARLNSDDVKKTVDEVLAGACKALNNFKGCPITQKAWQESTNEIREKLAAKLPAVIGELLGDRIPSFLYVNNNDSLAKSVELIPAKSYLNVNDSHAAIKAKNFMFLLKSLIGFGLNVNYQSQKEAYETFMSQDVFASALGKGTDTFGWVFGPEPGRKHMNPGTRTTHAVVWVPADARAVHIKREYCYFKKNSEDIDSNCYGAANGDAFVAVPQETEGFFVNGLDYQSVDVGSTAVVHIDGRDFSPQLSVLIDGVPLSRALSVGDPTLASEHNLPGPRPPKDGEKFGGEFEVINSESLILRITSAKDAPPGVPEITLVSPGRSISLNWFDLYVNRKPNRKLNTYACMSCPEPMFRTGFRVASAKFLARSGGKIRVQLLGGPFQTSDIVKVNGRPVAPADITNTSGTVKEISLSSRPDSALWTVSVESFGPVRPVTETASFADPLTPQRDTSKSPTVERVPGEGGAKDTAVIKIEGSSMYSTRTPVVKGGDDASKLTKTLSAEFTFATDQKSTTLKVLDPPKFIEVSFKAPDNDADFGLSGWPVVVKVPDPPKEEPKKK